MTTLTENYHKWDKSDNSQIHTVNVQVLQPRINTTTQRTRPENVDSSRILEAVLTMVQQRYDTSGGAFTKRGLRTSKIHFLIQTIKILMWNSDILISNHLLVKIKGTCGNVGAPLHIIGWPLNYQKCLYCSFSNLVLCTH